MSNMNKKAFACRGLYISKGNTIVIFSQGADEHAILRSSTDSYRRHRFGLSNSQTPQWVSINSENKFISKWGESLFMKSTAKNVENFVTRYFRFQNRLLEQKMESLEICTLTYWTISSVAANYKITVNFSNFRHVLRTILPEWLTDFEYEQKGICM